MRWSERAYRKGRCVAVGSRAIYRGEHGPARAATTLPHSLGARQPPGASPGGAGLPAAAVILFLFSSGALPGARG